MSAALASHRHGSGKEISDFKASYQDIRILRAVPAMSSLQQLFDREQMMALTQFGFIVTGDHFVQYQGTHAFSMKVVGVRDPSEGVEAAKAMVAEGIQLIELCGGFSPVWVGKIIEAIEYAVPVGVVAYGPESIDSLHRLFAD